MNAQEKNNYQLYVHYGYFNWIDYVNKKSKTSSLNLIEKKDIYYQYIKEESKKKSPIYFEINKNKNINFFTLNNLNVSFQDFPWESYIIITNDLKISGFNNKENAWNHWTHHGKKEERAFSLINNTNINKGRFGNLFFANMYLHFLSIKYDLKCNYKFQEKFKKLGFLFNNGNKMYNKNLLITKNNYLHILDNNYEPSNIIITNENWFQSNPFCLILQNYFNEKERKEQIKKTNIFRNRYGKNNDLFIHVRLGDISDKTQFLFPYYEKMLSSIKFNKAFISSDSINSPFCKKLISNYKLEIIELNDIETIMFGSTCNNIIMTGGSFSWLIGFLAFESENIYYPDTERFKEKWFGNIFNFTKWNCVKNF